MDSTVIKIIYTNAFNDLESARNCQNSISQKEMELQRFKGLWGEERDYDFK